MGAVLLAGCSSGDPGADQERPDYDPGVTASDFVLVVDNPWMPLQPGTRWVYEAEDERIDVEVLAETKLIMGVTATVVRDTVTTLDGELVEDTKDWFAQDRDGNVWYLGEETCEYEDGECVDRHGEWQWGVDGALPGIVMWAHPVANDTAYYQEFYWGEAIDQAAVVALDEPVTVPTGTYTDTVKTHEWNPLESGSDEFAWYAKGIGVVKKGDTDGSSAEVLVSHHSVAPPPI